MKTFKKVLRILGLVFLMLLAIMGVAITGVAPILPGQREKNYGKETRTELVEKKKKESSSKVRE